MWGSFLCVCVFQDPPVNGCSASCDLGVFAGRDECMTFYTTILNQKSILALYVNKIATFVSGGKGTGNNFWNNDIAQVNNINWLESNGINMADKTTPSSSINKWNDIPRGGMTVPRHCQKTNEWAVMSDSCNSMNCSLPAASVHGILQARILEWVAISLSRRFSRPRNWIWHSCMQANSLPIELWGKSTD